MDNENNSLDANIVRSQEVSLDAQPGVVGGSSGGSGFGHRHITPFGFDRLAFAITTVAVLVVLAIASVTYFLINSSHSKNDPSAPKSDKYSVSSVSTDKAKQGAQLQVGNVDHLAVNGQLQVSKTLVITPTSVPSAPTLGQFYFDKNTNTPYYFNGKEFVSIKPEQTSIQGITGSVNVGGGISLVNSTLVNSGVISIQGQTGAVNFASGSGIAINGSTITNTGVLGIGGNPNQLAISSGADGNVQLQIIGIQDGGVLIGTTGNGIDTVKPTSGGQCLISDPSTQKPVFGSCSGAPAVTGLTVGSTTLTSTVILQGANGIAVTQSGQTITVDGSGIAPGGDVSFSGTRIPGRITVLDSNGDLTNSSITEASGGLQVQTSNYYMDLANSGTSTLTIKNSNPGNVANLTVTGVVQTNGGIKDSNGNLYVFATTVTGSDKKICYADASNNSNCPTGGNANTSGTKTDKALTQFDGSGNIVSSNLKSDSSSLQATASAYSLDIFNNSANSTLNIVNSDGTGKASLSVEGSISTTTGFLQGTDLYTLPTGYGQGEICVLKNGGGSNCPSGGNVSRGGTFTQNKLTKFDASGNIIDSSILDQGTGLQATASSYLLDIKNDSAASTLTVGNSGTGNVANLTVTGLVTATGGLVAHTLRDDTANGPNSDLQITSTNNNIVFSINGGNYKFTFPTSGTAGATQTICTTGISCASGGGQALILEPSNAQTTTSSTPSIWVNRTSGLGNILQLQANGSDALVVSSTGVANIPLASGLVLGKDSTTAGKLSFKTSGNSNTVELTVAAGTGGYTLTLPTSAGNNGQCLTTNGSGVLSFADCLSGNGSGNGVTKITANSTDVSGAVTLGSTDGSVAFTVSGNTINLSAAASANNSANKTLSNLSSSTAINQSLLVASGSRGGVDLGGSSLNWRDLYLGTGTGSLKLDASAVTSDKTVSFSNISGTLVVAQSGTPTAQAGGISLQGGATFAGQLTANGSSVFGSIAITNKPSGGAIGTAAATVDVSTSFSVNQTTASQTLSLPAPTDSSTAGRIAYVLNAGSASFVMHGVTVASGAAQSYIYNGASWVPSSIDTGGNGITTIGTINSIVTKSADGAGISGNSIVLQSADPTHPGLVDIQAQTFAGAKTFSALATFSNGLTVTTGGATITTGGLTVTAGGIKVSTFNSAGVVHSDASGNLSNSKIVDADLTAGTFANITGTGALAAGSITSGFGTISTAQNISTTATIQGATLNGTSVIQLNGVDINASGTLSNVAYLGQANTFTAANTFSSSLSVTGSGGLTVGSSSNASKITLYGGGSSTNAIILQGDAPTGGTGTTATVSLTGLTNGTAYELCYKSTDGNSGNCTGVGGGVTASGTSNTNYVARFSGNTTLVAGTLYDSGSAVSVGGTSPGTGGLFNVGTSNQFRVSSLGAVTAVGLNSGSGQIQGSGGLAVTGAISLGTSNSNTTTIGSSSAGAIGVTSGAAINITGGAASTFTSGAGSFTLQGGNGSGSNAAGSNLVLNAGQGTGTGNGGNITFNVAKPSGSSGSSSNSLSTVATISGTDGSATFKNATDSTTAFQIQNANATKLLVADTSGMKVDLYSGLVLNGISQPSPSLSGSGTGGTLAAATYYYRVAAYNANSISGAVNTSPASRTTTGSTSQNTVSWSAVAGATGYYVYRATAAGGPYYRVDVSAATSAVDNGSNFTWSGTDYSGDAGYNGTASITLAQGGGLYLDPSGNGSIFENQSANMLTIGAYGTNQGIAIQADNFSLQTTAGGSYASTLSVTNTGATTFRNTTNSTSALAVLNTNAKTVAAFDTNNGRLILGDQSATNGVDGSLVFNTANNNQSVILKAGNTITGYTLKLPTAIGTANQCLTAGASGNESQLQFQSCSGGSFVNNGNTFGAAASLGTNDNFALSLRTNGTNRLTLDTSGNLQLQQASNFNVVSNTANAAGFNMTIQGGAATQGTNVGGNLVLQGGAGASTGASGSVIVKSNTNNSTAAFQVQNAAGTALLTADTTNLRVSVGSRGTATGQLYVAGNTPTGALGSANGSAASYGLAVQGRYAYTTPSAATNGFQVYDISNPASPSLVASANTTAGGNKRVKVQGKYAYVTGWVSSTSGTLQIFDISNPKLPVSVGSVTYTGGNNTPALYVQGRYAYVGDSGTPTLYAIDISSPTSPVLVGSVAVASTSNGPADIYVQGRYAYIVNGGSARFQIIDVSTPSAMTLVNSGTQFSSSNIAQVPTSVAVQGRYAYVGTTTGGSTYVIDVLDPTIPTPASAIVSSVSQGGVANSLVVQGRYLYEGDATNGIIRTFDISTPSSMTLISGTTTAASPLALVADGRYLYAANNSATNTLQSFDMGGAYTQQLEAGGIETDTLSVRGNTNFASDVAIQGGVGIGSGLQVSGNSAFSGQLVTSGQLQATGSVLFKNNSDSTTAFQVQNASGTSLLAADTSNFAVTVGALGVAGSFSAKVDSNTGTTPNGLSVGDFNGDGKPDVVVPNGGGSTLSVFHNSGTGYPVSATNSPTAGTWPNMTATGDFNGDGKPDVIATNFSSTPNVSVYTNSGSAIPNAASYTLSVTTGSPYGVATGDFNGDGKTDAVVVAGGTAVYVYLNSGTSLATSPSYSLSSGSGTYGVSTGDFNGDGKTDAISMYSGGSSVYMNSGSALPGTATTNLSSVGGAYFAGVGDFNGDGKNDLIIPGASGTTASIFINNGTGYNTTPTSSVTGLSAPRGVTIADLNNDGKMDAAITNSTSTGANGLVLLMNTGSGLPTTVSAAFTTGNAPQAVVAADVNSDGKQDLLVTNGTSGTLSVFTNNTPVASLKVNGSTTIQATSSAALNVQNAAGISLLNADTTNMALTVNGTQSIKTLTNSTTAFQVQNSAGTTMLNVDTTNMALTATGTATFKSSTNSTTAFQIQNSSAQSLFNVDTTNNIVTIGNSSNGATAAWTTQSSNLLPQARDSHGVTTYNGYIYVVGGNKNGTMSSTVMYAKVNADGSTGAWSCQGQNSNSSLGTYCGTAPTNSNTLPTAMSDMSLIAYGGYIYSIGGYDGTNYLNKVYVAKINADGSTGSWTDKTSSYSLPLTGGATGLSDMGTTVYNGWVYLVGGHPSNGSGIADVYYAKLGSGGTIGSWQTASGWIGGGGQNRRDMGAVVINGYLYALAGDNGASNLNIFYGKINADGTLSGTSSTAANSLNTGQAGGSVFTMNGYLYVVGYYNSGLGNGRIVQYAKVNSDGSVGTWSCQGASSSVCGSVTPVNNNTLPAERSYFGLTGVTINGYMYVVGGTNGSGSNYSTTSIYYTSTQRLQVNASLDLVGGDPTTMTDGGTSAGSSGGSLTAGNTRILGTLDVQSSVNVAQDMTVGGALNLNSTLTVAGAATFSSTLTVTGMATFSSGITVNGHIVTGGGTPAKVLGAANVTGGTGASCTITGTDTAGTIDFVSGTGTSITTAGFICSVVFYNGYTLEPHVIITPGNANAAGVVPYAGQSVSTSGFDFGTKNALTAGTSYNFQYMVVQ